MIPGPVARAVRGGLGRRRVQTAVIMLVVLASTAASVLALALVVDSSAPFDRAFGTQRGAHLAAALDPTRATPAQLARTSGLPEVTATAGPFPAATVHLSVAVHPPRLGGSQPNGSGGQLTVTLPAMTIVGRATPDGSVDQLVLQAGRWVRQPGEVVLATGVLPPDVGPGSTVTAADAPGRPVLTVVGLATSITGTAGGWVLPAQVPALDPPGAAASAQMLYRFRSAGDPAELRADTRAVTAALPPGTLAGTLSWLAARTQESGNVAAFVPFLVAFGMIGVLLSLLIVGNVVSGAVVAGYHRIGVLKSIGFSPAQVVATYTGQVTLPAVTGAVAGVLVGNLLAVPVLHQAEAVYEVGVLGVPTWVNATVPAAILVLAAAAAMLPALRAGRLSAIQAIATGRAPRSGRGRLAHRVLGRLPLPRPLTLGLAAPFARPARAAVTLTAVLLGATALTLAAGLGSSLHRVVIGLSHSTAEPVQVTLPAAGPNRPGVIRIGKPGGAPAPTPGQARQAVETALRVQPGTLHDVAEAERLVTVAGIPQPIQVTAFDGDAGWTGYDLIAGRWYTGPGEVVVAPHLLIDTGKAIGDTLTISDSGRSATVRIVGEIFDTHNDALNAFTGWPTLAALEPGLSPGTYRVGLRPGTSIAQYVQGLRDRLGPDYAVEPNTRSPQVLAVMLALIGLLTALLAATAGLGVLNTVLLQTREQVHDLGVFKALGTTPGQMIGMVVCWVAGTGLLAGLVSVPLGVALHHQVLPAMTSAVGLALPPAYLDVFRAGELAALTLAGVAFAAVGALLPASWAAATRTTTALRAE